MAEEKKKSGMAVGCAVVAVIVMIIVIAVMFGGGGSGGTSEPDDNGIELNAVIKYTGTQFEIKNTDTFAWLDVKLEINSVGLRSGYILRTDRMSAGETYTVGAATFTKKDGERFNPFTHAVTNFSIFGKRPDGKYGSYYGTYKQ